MALDAIRILGKKTVAIGIFGAGLSRDHELIQKLPPVSECFVIDLKNFQGLGNFIAIDSNQIKKFDIIIACEVIEHFINPRKEFKRLMDFVKPNGLIMSSTSLKIEDDFSGYFYPFLHGHTSYYTGKSLIFLAKVFGFKVDFRTPYIGIRTRSSKRYIYLTKSAKVQDRWIDFFSRYRYASSESPLPPAESNGQEQIPVQSSQTIDPITPLATK